MNIYDILFELLRAGLFGGILTEETKGCLTEEILNRLYSEAKKHDLAHLLAYSLEKCGLLEEGSAFQKKCADQQFMAVYRYENIIYEQERICKTLDEAEIPFILLKGSVIRQYYPERWMRTSCDIDILVKEDIVEQVKDILSEKLGFVYDGKSSHDYQMFSPGGVHVELHYTLVEENIVGDSNRVLNDVWTHTSNVKGYKNGYRMNDSTFYYYHILHMAKHIKGGGCGIRPFLDLYILENSVKYDSAKQALIAEGRLEKFDQVISRLANVWFGNQKHSSQTEKLGKYIAYGGVYGNSENRSAVKQHLHGGVFKYALTCLFEPYSQMIYRYPSLEGKKLLYPFYLFRHWFEFIFKKSFRGKVTRVKQLISTEKTESVSDMWDDLGL